MKNKFSIAMTLAVVMAMLLTSLAFADGTPTIASDLPDYAPGQTVNLFGTGWLASESVHIFVNDSVGASWSYNTDVTASDDGAITVSFQLPNWFVATYSVSATGASGTATTMFTDAPLSYSPSTKTLVVAVGSSVSFSQDVIAASGSGNFTTSLKVAGVGNAIPASWVSTSPSSLSFTNSASSVTKSWSVTFNVPANASCATYTANIKASPSTNLAEGPGTSVSLTVTDCAPSDTTPPDTIIDSGPAVLTNSANATFTFHSTEANSTFACSLDNAAFTPCTTPTNYSSLSNGGHTFAVKATDAANNTDLTPATYSWTVDTTPPTVTASPDRSADHNGWYNHAVTISLSADDASPCDDPVTYSGPDDGSASVPGTCTDAAGNVGTGVFDFKYDATAPYDVSGAPNRSADHGTWYNHAVDVVFTGLDETSGIDSCDTVNYSAPDGSGVSVNGSCTDVAGNTSAPVASSLFDYDATAPINVSGAPNRSADHGTWYNHVVDVVFTGSDAPSGVDSCTTVNYSGPDGTGLSVNGSCTDLAGNTSDSVASSAFDYDATKPTLLPTVTPNPITLNGSASADPGASDATSGIDSASCGAVDTSSVGGHSVNCTATDKAGNSNSALASYSVQYASTGMCLGAPGHSILQPINTDGSSVFKKGSTIPAKFRVCDANGASIGISGVVSKFGTVATASAPADATINETVASTTPDTAFRWSSTDQQWIFNVNTKNLSAGVTYFYRIQLNDGTSIDFSFTLK